MPPIEVWFISKGMAMRTIKLIFVIFFSIAVASCGGGAKTSNSNSNSNLDPIAQVVNNTGVGIDHVSIGNVTFNTIGFGSNGGSTGFTAVLTGTNIVDVYLTATSASVSSSSLGLFETGNAYAVNIRKVGGNYCVELWKMLDTNLPFNVNTTRVLIGTTCGSASLAPIGVTASPGSGQSKISWNLVTGATSYNLYMSTVAGVTKTNYSSSGILYASVASPYTVTGLTNGIPYYFVVTSVSGAGESVESTEVSVTPTIIVSQFDGTYTGSWSRHCPTCGATPPDNQSNTGTFTGTVANGVFTNISLSPPVAGAGGLLFSSGTVSTSGAITGTGAAPSTCTTSVSTFSGQITTNLTGGAQMSITYSRPASTGGCMAESGTITATRP